MTLPYPPPWQDISTLVAHISVSPHTIENWIARYGFPAARMRGGKRMWKWAEVDAWLNGGDNAPKLGALADAVRRDLQTNGTH